MHRAAFNEAGVATRSDQALQVLLSRRCHAEGSSSNVRRGHGVFRVYRNVHSARRGLVPTPDAVIFAELLSPLVEGAISVSLPPARHLSLSGSLTHLSVSLVPANRVETSLQATLLSLS